MTTSKILIIGIIVLLLLGNFFFLSQYTASQRALREATAALEAETLNEDVLNFTKLFIDTVLNAQQEIDFETRLMLENAVRNLQDQEVLSQWQNFVNSQTETQAQQEVKNLLQLLISKMSI